MSRTITRRKVVTEHICPPTFGSRCWDWMAYFEGDDEDGLTGYGATEADAILDLAEQAGAEDEPVLSCHERYLLATREEPEPFTAGEAFAEIRREMDEGERRGERL